MKWSSPLPRLRVYTNRYPRQWMWGFHLLRSDPPRRGIVLEVSFAVWSLHVYLTWPERRKL